MADDDTPDFAKLFSDLRRSASFKAGAIMFGEAQSAYYETLKEHMTEEAAYSMTAHTTECLIKGVAAAAGPMADAFVRATYVWERLAQAGSLSDKQVPGAN